MLIADPPSGEHYRNIPASLLNEDDGEHSQTEDDQDDEDQPPVLLVAEQ